MRNPCLLSIFLEIHGHDEITKPLDFVRLYGRELQPRRNERLVVAEIGVYRGQFLAVLGKYLPNSKIIGIDKEDFRTIPFGPSTSFHLAAQEDATAIDRILTEVAPTGLDVVIDDASHLGSLSLALYRMIVPRWLRPNGVYFIEDWGTGYWPDWRDGLEYNPPQEYDQDNEGLARRIASHDAGMVGFIKSLVDEVAAPADWRPTGPQTISSISIWPGIVKIQRA